MTNPNEKHICAEIVYDTDEGGVHSDLCGVAKDYDTLAGWMEWRRMLHANLDEWLNKSNGTGIFYIGDLNCDWLKED